MENLKEKSKNKKSLIRREGLTLDHVKNIATLKRVFDMAKLSKIIKSDLLNSTDDVINSFEEEKKISDELENFLGEKTYIDLFFTKEQKMYIASARTTYEELKNINKSEVKKLLIELDPDKLYQSYKYMPNIKTFDEIGVRKMMENPEISKAEKKFLAFNLDKVSDGGIISLNFKELIYNRFIKGNSDE